MKFVATVQLMFEASGETDACDAVSAMLNDNLMQGYSAPLIDWEYLQLGGQHVVPGMAIKDIGEWHNN